MVTKDRIAQRIHNIENVPPIGQGENGVGYMQLTMLQLVSEANEMGGAWVPRYNIRRGLQLVRSSL